MIQKLKLTLVSLMTLLTFSVPLATGAIVSAQTPPANIQQGVCEGADKLQVNENPNTSCSSLNTGGANDPNNLITKIVNVLSVIVGIVAVIMIIIGGFRYITSGGSAEKVKSARDTLLYAIIGLIIVALAQIIVRFVLKNTAG